MKLARLSEGKLKIINRGTGHRKGSQRIVHVNFLSTWRGQTKTKIILVEFVSMVAITNIPKPFIIKSVTFSFSFY